MKKIWAITSGEYSSYGIFCVCASREIAETVAARLNGSGRQEYDVEEFDLLESDGEVSMAPVYRVHVDDQGRETNRWSYVRYALGRDLVLDPEGGEVMNSVYGKAVGVSHRGYEEALKSARDVLTQAKARAAGL